MREWKREKPYSDTLKHRDFKFERSLHIFGKTCCEIALNALKVHEGNFSNVKGIQLPIIPDNHGCMIILIIVPRLLYTSQHSLIRVC